MKQRIIILTVILLMLSLPAFGSHGVHDKEGGNKEYYSNGNVKSIGTTLKNGKKNGQWQLFFNTGKLMAEGTYQNGEKVGKWTYWGKDGRKLRVQDHGEAKPASESPDSSEAVSAHSGDESKRAATMEEWKKVRNKPDATKKRAATMEEWKKMQSGK